MDSKIIIIPLILLVFYWLYWCLRLLNTFKFHLYIGKKGSGKSTVAAKIIARKPKALFYDKSRKFFRRFRIVPLKIYTNFDLNIKGVDYELFRPTDLGITFFPEEFSLLLCDEISLYWWNRMYKSMDPRTVEWFRNQRKYKVRFIGFSQTFDVDKVLRTSLCDRMYLVKSFMTTWSVVRLIDKQQTIKESALDCDSQLVDSLRFAPIFVPGAIKFTWIPHWIKLFDTNQIFSKDTPRHAKPDFKFMP